MALLLLGLTLSRKLIPKAVLSFQQSFQKQLDSATINFKAQANAQNIQLAPLESTFICAFHVEVSVKKMRPKFDSKMRNREPVSTSIQGLLF